MKKYLFGISFIFFLLSCGKRKTEVDLIVHNAVVYTVDSVFSVTEAMAIKDGKIVETGSGKSILENFDGKDIMDAGGKVIFPGFIDAHCHFFNYGLGLDEVDLVGTKSFDEVIERLQKFTGTKKNAAGGRSNWILGRGWDQNDWNDKSFPDRAKLDSLFPDRPVFLKRIDGHAALANRVALALARIGKETKVDGGIVEQRKFIPKPDLNTLASSDFNYSMFPGTSPSGILVDNAVDLVEKIIPEPTKEEMFKALLRAQQNCFAVGLTTVDDAGLMKDKIDVMDEMQKAGDLKMRVYAMLLDSAPNYEYYLKNGPYKSERMNVCSFKFYGDGALGSRGACLKQDYTDRKGWNGFLLRSVAHYTEKAQELSQTEFQMNTHCIGDSAFSLMMNKYSVYMFNPWMSTTYDRLAHDRRWRIEHAQVTDTVNYFLYLNSNYNGNLSIGIIPSVQPTHATSDMYWAQERLGPERIKYAYAYKTLLKNAGIIALGTDFPVEDISPFKTFYAAVFRKDAKGFPEGGFQMEEALTREETIRGMTIWAAFSNFEENEKGSLEKGKYADFIILDTDLMSADEKEILKTKVISTYINGEKVYQLK